MDQTKSLRGRKNEKKGGTTQFRERERETTEQTDREKRGCRD